MKFLALGLLLLQFGPRAPLTPAETLLDPAILKAINEEPAGAAGGSVIEGSDAKAGEILVTCAPGQCAVATQAAQKLQSLVASRRIPQPSRTVRLVSTIDAGVVALAKTAIHVAQSADRPMQVVRGLWSTAGIGDEVAEVFSKQGAFVVEARPYETMGQLPLDSYGVPTTTIVANTGMSNQQAALVAAAAYFLATLPHTGAEALLSHLTVGAHARLAEDGRKAVALMGNQQRAARTC